MIYDLFKGITFILPVLYTFLPLEPYDGVILKQGSSGDRVELLQEYLNAIAETYTDIPTVEVLGVFGPQTYNSVVAFQKLFGLTVDGIVGEATWQALLDVYESTLRRENPEVPQYPGYPLLEGMSD
jgi:peptidoglycan hydrolase-like protein with peptidoglycan-binding domain